MCNIEWAMMENNSFFKIRYTMHSFLILYALSFVLRMVYFIFLPKIPVDNIILSNLYNSVLVNLSNLACGWWLYRISIDRRKLWGVFGVACGMSAIIFFIIIMIYNYVSEVFKLMKMDSRE